MFVIKPLEKLGLVGKSIIPTTWRLKQVNYKFKTWVNYKMSWRPAWAISKTLSGERGVCRHSSVAEHLSVMCEVLGSNKNNPV